MKAVVILFLLAVSSQAGTIRVARHALIHPIRTVDRTLHGVGRTVRWVVW